MINIKIAEGADLVKVQAVFNERTILPLLGGFCILDSLKGKAKGRTASVWLAEYEPTREIVGACVIAGRPQSHLVKYGEIGVLPHWRRKRVGTALYLAMTAQGVLEGRRLYEDTIVGDNPNQFLALPTMGLRLAGELRHRTGSGKSICLFQFSLLDPGTWEHMVARVPADRFTIQVRHNRYAQELSEKNRSIYAKNTPAMLPYLDTIVTQVTSKGMFSVIGGNDPVHNQGKQRVAAEEKDEL